MSRTLSCIIPNAGDVVERVGVAAMGRAAEAAGAEGLWVSDHLLMVDRPVTTYPYSDDGTIAWSTSTDYFEALAVLAHLAAVTERCRLGTAVLILPQRGVLQLAKEVATIDRLSGGRLELGVGAGWYGDEMEALGFDFATRGVRMEEMLVVLRSAWSGRPAAFEGRALRVEPDLVLHPVPVRPEGPPIHIGGSSAAALRRAARYADGWVGIAYADSWDRGVVAGQLAALAERARSEERTAPLQRILKLHTGPAGSTATTGEAAADAFDLGFDEVIVELPWDEGAAAGGEVFQRIRAAVS